MTNLEKTLAGLEFARNFFKARADMATPGSDGHLLLLGGMKACANAAELLKAQEPITGETSDGYHTFNELYHHRAVLFSVIVANYPDRAWKAKKHHDGTMYDGMFIVGIETPDGQATYHYDIDPYWDMFECRVLDNAPEWDGHTPAQAIERIGKLALLKAQEARVMTLEEYKAWADIPFCERDPIFHEMKLRRGPVTGWTNTAECSKDNYGKTERCWTSRPTDEQRQAVKWG